MQLLYIGFLMAFMQFHQSTPLQTQSTVSSTLKKVTVYQAGASLEHIASTPLKQGNQELVIGGLSSYLDINSIQVHCPEAVTILGMEFSNQYMAEAYISPSVKHLTDSLEKINQQIQQNNILTNTSTELLEVLRVNKEIKGTQSGLSVAELTKLMDYYKNKSIAVQTELMELRNKKKVLDDISLKLKNQIAEEKKKNTQSGGRITLQLSVAVNGKYDFNVHYISQNAYWTPYYDIKCRNTKDPLAITYKAKISQSTGIDWNKVNLSLSTASPKQYGNAPLLKTWFLGYVNTVRNMNNMLSKSNTFGQILQGQAPGLEVLPGSGQPGQASTVFIRGNASITGNSEPLYIINGIPMEPHEFSKLNPNDFKSVEVLKDAAATSLYGSRGANGVVVVTTKSGLEDYITVSESTLDVTYDISLPYDVPTNGKPQIATLKEAEMPAVYKYYAVPKLDRDAYLLAEITNWQSMNFLPGEANIIFEGTYIGKSFLDPANTNDTLNLTLGTDKRVVVKREKVTDFSSVKFLGSNKSQTVTYDITVRNSKTEPIQLILKDQYPISTNKEIEVHLLESNKGSVNEEIGVVTWQLSIPPGTNEKKRISYNVRYPKGKVINLQ